MRIQVTDLYIPAPTPPPPARSAGVRDPYVHLLESQSARGKELSGFKDWLEKFSGWLSLIHDAYGPELWKLSMQTIPSDLVDHLNK